MLTNFLIGLCEAGLVPDALTRRGIRNLLAKRLEKVDKNSVEANEAEAVRLVNEFSNGPIALLPEKANEQHYEVPAKLYELMLGPRRKYSSCLYPEGCKSLDEAEKSALEETCQHADLRDGQDVLELGCGWGSLTLWMAEKFPNSNITAVSNSASQREFIVDRATERGFADRLNIITCDMNDFQMEQQFDRVVSVEMFEHMRNYQRLLQNVSSWLKPEGKLFVHIFCHKNLTYEFVDAGDEDWMSRHFFSGGIMPGADFIGRFGDHVSVEQHWSWNGNHYRQTCDAWLKNMDQNRADILPVLESNYGKAEGKRWFYRWRMFHMACSELFGFNDGEEWFVSHYLFSRA
jgi:cyclopropane-fatty-acyl-phospholipid synthase